MTALVPRFFTTSLLPVRERLVLRGGRWRTVQLRVRVGYLHHPRFGHTLIDTGYSLRMTQPGPDQSLLLALYRKLIGPSTLGKDPLGDGLRRLGLVKSDISTVLLTHLHADHVSGLEDVPQAHILCPAAALSAFRRQGRLRNALEGVFAEVLPPDFERRITPIEDAAVVPAPLGLGSGFDLAGDGSILAIDLPGHLAGHAGLCFPRADRPLLYATDAQWLLQAVTEGRCPGFPASLIAHDRLAARQSVRRIRAFVEAGGEVMLCHDPHPHPLDLDPEVGG